MKKKFMLWLCKILKVNLVEPIKQEMHVSYVHEKVPYTQIFHRAQINKFGIRPEDELSLITEHKKSIVQKIAQHLVEEDILTWDEYDDVFTQTHNIQCSFFAAKKPTQLNREI